MVQAETIRVKGETDYMRNETSAQWVILYVCKNRLYVLRLFRLRDPDPIYYFFNCCKKRQTFSRLYSYRVAFYFSFECVYFISDWTEWLLSKIII
jgi:hypothetical protein